MGGVHRNSKSIVEVLRRRASETPLTRAFVFLADGEKEEIALSYAELDARARAIAACLRERTRPGDRALLLFPPGLEYIASFFGCLYAGVVAVPVYPPDVSRLKRSTTGSKNLLTI